jgi:hypothetical protein
MSARLQARAKAFLERPIPSGISYVPDSISERFIAAYATDGTIDVDAELAELLAICVLEGYSEAQSRSGEDAAYFRESAEILEAIQTEMSV